MSTTNQQLIKKADIALADLATAGKLNPQQTNRFIRKLIDAPTLLNSVRTVGMTAPQMNINKIGFGTRIMNKAVSATALSAGSRVKPDLAQVQLNTAEVIAEVNIPYDVLEDNIEGGRVDGKLQDPAGGMHQTIVDLIADRAALDLEELFIQGDTASGTPWLTVTDGIVKRITSNVVNVSAVISKDAVKSGLKAMPSRFLRDRTSMVHFFAVNNETELRDQYGNRQTSLGDQHVQGNLPLFVFGSQVKGAAMMPSANGIFTNPQNLIFGIQRNVQIEYDKDIRARVFVIVLTARIAVQIEEETACVKYTNIS